MLPLRESSGLAARISDSDSRRAIGALPGGARLDAAARFVAFGLGAGEGVFSERLSRCGRMKQSTQTCCFRRLELFQ
jgi:hypothetical protein